MHSVTSGAVANYASKIIKYKDVSISNITFSNGGYVNVESYIPDGMTNFMFAMLRGWRSVSANTPLAIETNGKWLWCSPNATCSNVYIRYYYTD